MGRDAAYPCKAYPDIGGLAIGVSRGEAGPEGSQAAHLAGAPSCNGWIYRHFKRDGKMVPIDILRQQIRAEMEADQAGLPN